MDKMAKDVYRELTTTELCGIIDITEDGEIVVFVEQGKDLPLITVNILDVLEACKGQQISLKLTNERNNL